MRERDPLAIQFDGLTSGANCIELAMRQLEFGRLTLCFRQCPPPAILDFPVDSLKRHGVGFTLPACLRRKSAQDASPTAAGAPER